MENQELHAPASPDADWQNDPYAAAYPETGPFWEAAQAGRLLLKACRQCDRPHWYPRVVCPFCRSDDLEWRAASGEGSIYSYSVVRRAAQPYVLAYVALAEGPVMLTNIVECDMDALRIGQRVGVRFRQAEEGRMYPVFVPAD
jgi:uncharacterized OB-fold protein